MKEIEQTDEISTDNSLEEIKEEQSQIVERKRTIESDTAEEKPSLPRRSGISKFCPENKLKHKKTRRKSSSGLELSKLKRQIPALLRKTSRWNLMKERMSHGTLKSVLSQLQKSGEISPSSGHLSNLHLGDLPPGGVDSKYPRSPQRHYKSNLEIDKYYNEIISILDKIRTNSNVLRKTQTVVEGGTPSRKGKNAFQSGNVIFKPKFPNRRSSSVKNLNAPMQLNLLKSNSPIQLIAMNVHRNARVNISPPLSEISYDESDDDDDEKVRDLKEGGAE